jgi:dihydrofolate synthase/folylpolyglutamate synthase
LHTARERIKFNRNLITKKELVKFGNNAINLLQNFNWTVFFDILLATSILFFNEKKTNYIILESGIGGRFDSTNFIDSPVACVITSISLDHQAILGDNVEKIAWQKAGIIKKNSHVFTPNSQQQVVLNVIQQQCDAVGAILHVVDVDM